jgi:pimeloyl-ACP methyl ester carboxylesterase
MRRGFGHSDGPVMEISGPCDNRNYVRSAQISADDVVATVQALKAQAWVDPTRILLVGVSTGGLAVTAAAARKPASLVGVVNFAGGRGSKGPDEVCQPERLVEAVRVFGEAARAPALWIYAENDHFFGPDLAGQMFAAYTGGGAPATLVMERPFGEDGHFLFTDAPERWWPTVDDFLDRLHLPVKILVPPVAADLLPPLSFGTIAQESFRAYLRSNRFEKAFAMALTGNVSAWRAGQESIEDAEAAALQECSKHAPQCKIYAAGNQLAR